MELLFYKYRRMGRLYGLVLVPTCQIQIIKGSILEKIGVDEKQTLSKIGNSTKRTRLACQIPVTSQLDGIVFRILKDNDERLQNVETS